MKTTKKITLPEDQIPKQWYNILADMPTQPQPLLNPQTREPLKAEEMEQLLQDTDAHVKQYKETHEGWL